MADLERRRRRLRYGLSTGADGSDGSDGRSAVTPEVHDPEPTGPRQGSAAGPPAEDRDGERGLRGLLGSGASQVGVSAALRARDAARPRDAELAEAEERLVVVRRNWVPREDLPRHGR
jgi:hypothetical protein